MEILPMVDPNLKPLTTEVDQLFEMAIAKTANIYPLKRLHRVLKNSQQRLKDPMRVAIVGLIKAGKSTLMNALLEQSVVAMGSVEATFNVNWLKYADQKSIIVHFKDENKSPEEKSFADLEALTLRAQENQDYLLSIKYIEVFYPNKILKTLNIIDTPGLNSVYEDDSDNTKNFLQMHGKEMSEVTKREADNADAVLYLFSQSLGAFDAETIEQLQGPLGGNTTPINAIGVLTKVDFYIGDRSITNPLERGKIIAQRLHNEVRRLFYTIQPVCGLLGLGAKTLTLEHWDTLVELGKLSAVDFAKLTRRNDTFIKDEKAIATNTTFEQRKKLAEHLGFYGVIRAYDYIHSVKNCEELGEKLIQDSGLVELRHLLLSHFGDRALLIKLGKALQDINNLYYQEKQRLNGQALEILEEICSQFDTLRCEEQSFQELDILRSYYEEKLELTETEIDQLLQVTGEKGISFAEKLGLDETASNEEMIILAKEKIQYWQNRANDCFTGNNDTIHAARILARSYERLFYQLRQKQ